MGMNVTNTPIKNWLSPKDPETTQDLPIQRLWDMRWFALLSAPLLFGTILLPLLTGPFIRWVVKSYLSIGRFWRVGFFVAFASYMSLYYNTLEDSWAAEILTVLFDTPLAILGAYCIYQAYRLRTRTALWTSTWVSIVIIICFCLDFVNSIPSPILLYGSFGWIFIVFIRLFSYSRAWARRRRNPKEGGNVNVEAPDVGESPVATRSNQRGIPI